MDKISVFPPHTVQPTPNTHIKPTPSYALPSQVGLVSLLLVIIFSVLGISNSLAPARSYLHDHTSHDHHAIPHTHGDVDTLSPPSLTKHVPDPAELAADHAPDHPHGHEGDEGLMLAAADEDAESVTVGAPCPSNATLRSYLIAAIPVQITLNRYLDYDVQGRMYVLEEELGRVRQEEEQNKEARAGKAEPAVSLGLQGDAIQPLILRVNQGECLQITLRNGFVTSPGEAVSLHLHGSSLYLAETGDPAIASTPAATVAPSETVTYRWWVSLAEPEGTHYFHSHGNVGEQLGEKRREQTSHGLFGAVIVEPHGSRYLNPRSSAELHSGWDAVIVDPNGANFREFALIYHEIGNERYRHQNRNGRLVEQVDPYTHAYRPGDRALNYRSEPFMNRLQLQQERFGSFDESLVYSSYSFGDPATPIGRSYLGDPVKQRVVHGGSEVFHVHHVHGGATRWPRQPQAAGQLSAAGLLKHPSLLPQPSERTDAQSLGPAESFDIESECGSGGCQQSAGDFLFHCHVAHHYFAGMWGIWRVYNTLQDGFVSQDSLPPLGELPDRKGGVKAAVISDQLIGATVDWYGLTFTITQSTLADWVEPLLPPVGVPQGYDASVWNWHKEGARYFGEPESDQQWPGYQSAQPTVRPPLYFDPQTGKLAYPLLRPHLGMRPPFAPNHGPAPFLDPIQQGTGVPEPGANGPGSLCPAGTRLKPFAIHAINLPVPLNAGQDLIDPSGALFVLKGQEAQVRQENRWQTPLAIRANAGEDCIDIVFKSELADNRENNFHSKVSLHIHFVQFDVQASDGVDTGFNYEQTLRPFTVEGEPITTPASAGAVSLAISRTQRFQPGVLVGVGMDQDATFEIKRIQRIKGDQLIFDEPLQFDHVVGEIVSPEFLRQRWYPDVQFGTAFFHDHVNTLVSLKHGLFGALIAEPPGATYHDPHTGEPVESGAIADIHSQRLLSTDVTGSFRELVLFVQDEVALTRIAPSSGSLFNLRAEPLAGRDGDPAQLFSSLVHGDPTTPILEAQLGDPLAIRALVAGANEVHTVHVDGHWFRIEPFSPTSPPVNTVHLGISERYDLIIPQAGGPQQRPGDYLYYNGRDFKFREGSWGLIRVYGGGDKQTLQPLPGHENTPTPAPSICPVDAAQKIFAVTAITATLPMLKEAPGKIYVLDAEKEMFRKGGKAVEPLVLHVNVGDCIVVNLRNETGGAISFHADMLAVDPQTSLGVAAGNHPTQTVQPGATRPYTYFADPAVGETVALVRDWGNVIENPRLGLYGAIIVGPRGASYSDPVTGEDMSLKAGWRVDVHPRPEGTRTPGYRDFALFLQDEDALIGTAAMPYRENVEGVVGLNYGAQPLLEAFVGDAMKVHVLVPFSEQAHVFTLEGHRWPQEVGLIGSNLLSAVQVGALEAITLVPLDGAGGEGGQPGDYLYGDHREPFREAGLWGGLRVYSMQAEAVGLERLGLNTFPGARSCPH